MIEQLTELGVQVAIPIYSEEKDRFALMMPIPGSTKDSVRVFINKNVVRITVKGNEFFEAIDFSFMAIACRLQDTEKEVVDGVMYLTIYKKEEDLEFEVE